MVLLFWVLGIAVWGAGVYAFNNMQGVRGTGAAIFLLLTGIAAFMWPWLLGDPPEDRS